MKNSIYILTFSIIMFFGCNSNKTDVYPSFKDEVADAKKDSFSEKISLEELPVPIKKVIHEDELFNGLNIHNIKRITQKDSIYYDMTFKDLDGQLIMVFYDEEGKIIVP